MSGFPGSFAFDEYGRPFIILREQDKQKRITGTDAIKVKNGLKLKLHNKNKKKMFIYINRQVWKQSIL